MCAEAEHRQADAQAVANPIILLVRTVREDVNCHGKRGNISDLELGGVTQPLKFPDQQLGDDFDPLGVADPVANCW